MTDRDSLPPPPWVRGANRGRRNLSLNAIMDSAMRILETEGLEATTMRRVAQDLGTGAGSLYAYVQNKAELHELLLDAAMATIDIPEPDPARWREQLMDLLLDTAHALIAKPGVARVALDTVIPTTPRALQLMDGVLALLHAGGIPPRDAMAAADALSLHLTAAAYEMSLTTDPAATARELQRRTSQITQYLDILPPDRLPRLRASLTLFTDGEDAQPDGLRLGLEMLLNGLLTRVRPAQQ
ncbi:TetR/AcrR family transcriptional regulator [Spirillospora sp. NPDC029432]|uniref:TetR/AcrR family transcriptional regulator n=1 Tax=Spirillospora sp. NPDC029432 TaxID=3154599 RepID=UPI003456D448